MEPSKIRGVRSSLAMQIARLDKQKFNDAVRDKHYECAPYTTRGSSRVFTGHDLVTLFIFARLLDMDMPSRVAGAIACEFGVQAQTNPKADRLVHLRGTYGGFTVPSEEYDPDHMAKGRHYPGIGGVVWFTLEFNIRAIREHIEREILEELSIIGREDDEEE